MDHFNQQKFRIAVIGGGPMGLAVAYELTRLGQQPVLLEADDRLGGMAACFDFAGMQLERFYHFHCLTDTAFFKMLRELGLEDQVQWRTQNGSTWMGASIGGNCWRSFALSAVAATGSVFATRCRCLTIRNWRSLDGTTATQWLRPARGATAALAQAVRLSFHHSDQVSAAWIWSRIRRLGIPVGVSKTLGFLSGGSQQLIDAMADAKELEGEIQLVNPVRGLALSSGGAALSTSSGELAFDCVISTVPLPLMAPVLKAGGVEPALVDRYRALPSVACACVVLQTRRPVTANFWTNVNDSRFAIPGVIEMSNLRHLQGHIAYAPFYIPADHPDYQR